MFHYPLYNYPRSALAPSGREQREVVEIEYVGWRELMK